MTGIGFNAMALVGALFAAVVIILNLKHNQFMRHIANAVGLTVALAFSVAACSPMAPSAAPSEIPPVNTTVPPETPTATPPPVDTSTPTAIVLPTPAGKLLFNNDFNDGSSRGFHFRSGKWSVVDDGTGNKVLQADPVSANNLPNATFGPANFTDGTVEFRLRITRADLQLDHHVAEFGFRNQALISGNQTHYILAYEPAPPPGLTMYYQEKGGPWQSLDTGPGGVPMPNGVGDWASVRVELQGQDMNVLVDGSPLLTVSDSRDSGGGLFLAALGDLTVQFDDINVWGPSK